jgi:cytochrome c-type biogenesis protein
MLSMLPITIGYIGGYETKSRLQAAAQSTWFALGLATTLAGLGILSAFVGKKGLRSSWNWCSILLALLLFLMGCNLLDALPLPLPSVGSLEWIQRRLTQRECASYSLY